MYIEFGQYLKQSSILSSEKTDLDIYLEEPAQSDDDFDILKWWKNNSSKYHVLLQVVRDVLAIPVSTVVSKSAFSTGSKSIFQMRMLFHLSLQVAKSLMRMRMMCLKFLVTKLSSFLQLLIRFQHII